MKKTANLQNSYFSLVRKRFLKNRVGILGLVFVTFLIFSAVLQIFYHLTIQQQEIVIEFFTPLREYIFLMKIIIFH